MKRILVNTALLFCALTASISVYAQSNQAPTLQQTTSTEDTRKANPPKPMLKPDAHEQRELQKGLDTTMPRDRQKTNQKQRRLRPDSLRRGGATRVDTIRK